MSSVRVQIRVPPTEFQRWTDHAERERLELDHWLRRIVNFVLDAEIDGTKSVTLGHQRRLITEVRKCVWCGRALPPPIDVRKRYCSDSCRVRAWRARRRASTR
jgi:predicted nucleic acid-binding Zn ribbon protein